jgi:hypothetical protein
VALAAIDRTEQALGFVGSDESAIEHDLARLLAVDTSFPPGDGYGALADLAEQLVTPLGFSCRRVSVPERLWSTPAAADRAHRPEGAGRAADLRHARPAALRRRRAPCAPDDRRPTWRAEGLVVARRLRDPGQSPLRTRGRFRPGPRRTRDDHSGRDGFVARARRRDAYDRPSGPVSDPIGPHWPRWQSALARGFGFAPEDFRAWGPSSSSEMGFVQRAGIRQILLGGLGRPDNNVHAPDEFTTMQDVVALARAVLLYLSRDFEEAEPLRATTR